MENPRAFLRRLATGNPDDLAEAVLHAGGDERQVLEATLGAAQLEEIRTLAEEGRRRSSREKLGNVAVLHGIMGGELTRIENGGEDTIWVSLWRLFCGQFVQLALDGQTGLSPQDVRASGILLRYYAKQLVSLARDWNVRPFYFDWRSDIRTTAQALRQSLDAWFGPEGQAHLVAHSMGGLVARCFAAMYPERWRTLAGRLVMLGTPNYGSFAIPRLLFGNNSVLHLIDKIDFHHSLEDLLRVAATFPSTYQMLPSPDRLPGLEPLFKSATYTQTPVPQRALDDARDFQRLIAPVVDPSRMLYLAGYNRSTPNKIADYEKLASDAGYRFSLHGDGTVPHNLGLLDGVKTYFADCDHQSLPANNDILHAMTSLLTTGAVPEGSRLVATLPLPAAAPAAPPRESAKRLAALSHLVAASARMRAGEQPSAISSHDGLLADLLAGIEPEQTTPNQQTRTVRIHIVETPIEALDPNAGPDPLPIDAIAVGHYDRVAPTGAERDLDRTLSASLPLTRFHERGVLRGALGEQFLLPDPRAGHENSLIIAAGMGRPATFGSAELSVLVRELSLTLSQLARRHLAAVLIGASGNNLTVQDAARAWVEGLNSAAATSGLEAVTFAVLPEERTKPRLTAALFDQAARLRAVNAPLALDLSTLDPPRAEVVPEPEPEPAAARLSIEFASGVCTYSALSDGASLAEREIRIHPRRIAELNQRLRQEPDPGRRLALGRFLLDFLFPRDLLGSLAGDTPIVVAVNNAAARIHWELAAQTGADSPVGLLRGLTRQLRTQFAPAPQPSIGSNRPVRVLLVADGAAEHPLPGAQREARALADLFGAQGIECRTLLGPSEATALNVLLAIHDDPPFDVLHYAGHCVFREDDPAASGFLFSNGDVLNPGDLGRIDRVPRFVFANACESGALPERSAAMAPSLAETFFSKGVGNFVCTAWPVEDDAALTFSRTLYETLLGPAAAPAPMWRAMRRARQSIAHSACWAAYQHYGDPYFRLLR
jgi:pimeloyl-ACP methyl ester carboxylesterase